MAAQIKHRVPRQNSSDLPFDQSVGYQIRIAQRGFIAELHSRVAPYGVSAGMWFFLRILWQEDGITQSELSRRIGLREPTALMTVSKMSKSGLITRQRDAKDKRRINVFLTKKGLALKQQMLPIAHEVNAKALQDLSTREVELLLEMLRKINRQLAGV